MSATVVTEFDGKVSTAYDALEAAGLNFAVEQAPIINSATGKTSDLKKSLYRSDTNEELGIVGMKYHPVQNFTAFSYFDSVCELYGATYSSAISVNGGAQIILKARFPHVDLINKNDEVMKEFILINGHDGIVGLRADFMLERLVCTNGLRASFKGVDSSFKFKHTLNVKPRMADALLVLDNGIKYFDHFITMSTMLTQKHVDDVMVKKFLDEVVGEITPKSDEGSHGNNSREKKRDAIEDLFLHGKGNNGDTLFDLYNGATEYADHFFGKEDTRLKYNYLGEGIKFKEQAFSVASSML